MESPEDIEKALSRLVPSALSGPGQRSLDELIDGLAAGEEKVAAGPAGRSRWPWIGGIGAAAAALVVGLNLPAGDSLVPADGPVASLAGGDAGAQWDGGVVLLQHSKRVEAAVPEDWMSETDGVAYRAWRVRVVDEERLHDLETGYEVLVSHPREEVRLLPVTSF